LDVFFEAIGWYPKIGDATLMGWLTVFFYFATFILSLKVVSVSESIFTEQLKVQKQFWIIISCLMFLLCINKQLDLQSLLTALGRFILKEQGLYDYKRLLQVVFIASIFLAALIGFLFIVKKLYKVAKKEMLAIFGIVFLLMFILIRASSFHNIDSFIGYSLLGFKMNWFIELSGIGLIFINGIFLLRVDRSKDNFS
jgi:hypothetical protein